jgi:hypothetical protein
MEVDQLSGYHRSAVSFQVIIGQRSAVSGQRSAVSGQRSAVSGQRSAVSGQRSAISYVPVVTIQAKLGQADSVCAVYPYICTSEVITKFDS